MFDNAAISSPTISGLQPYVKADSITTATCRVTDLHPADGTIYWTVGSGNPQGNTTVNRVPVDVMHNFTFDKSQDGVPVTCYVKHNPTVPTNGKTVSEVETVTVNCK